MMKRGGKSSGQYPVENKSVLESAAKDLEKSGWKNQTRFHQQIWRRDL